MTAAAPVEMLAAATERPLVVFTLDDQRYAVPLACVQRTLRVVAVTPLPEASAMVLGIVDLGGMVVPVIDTRRRFNHPPREVRLSDHLVIATTGKQTVALMVDAVTGVMRASPANYQSAGRIMSGFDCLEGVVKLTDGLVLIHDLECLLSFEGNPSIGRVPDTGGGGAPASGGRDHDPESGDRGR